MLITDGILPVVEFAGASAYTDGFPVTQFGRVVKEIEFTKFIWPPNLREEFLLMKLENQFGSLIIKNDPSLRPVLNLATAARFLISRLNLRYRYQSDGFTMSADDGLADLARTDLAAVIQDWLAKKAAKAGIAAPGDEMTNAVIGEIVKITAISTQEGLRRFLDKCVERRAAESVTMAELLELYQKTCEDEGAAMLPARKFYREVTDACGRRFGTAKSHDIIRRRSLDGKETARSGFRNLSLKCNSPDVSEGSETSGTSEVTDASGGLAK